MVRNISQKDVKLLWGLSAARCAFPACRMQLVAEATASDPVVTLGEMAHIVAHSESDGPRADSAFPQKERDSYQNLILLCQNHHTLVDKQPNTYTVYDLRQWKADHERFVTDSLRQEMTTITFLELEIVAKAIISSPALSGDSLTLTPPKAKMDKNGFVAVRSLVTLGLANAKVVEHFVKAFAQTAPAFPADLKAGFLREYRTRWDEGMRGDELFEALNEFASSGSRDFRRQAAGLSILVYLFEKCEVFEP